MDYFEAEADESHGMRNGHLEAIILLHQIGEFTGQIHLFADVLSHSFRAVRAHHEPQFQRAESSTQRNLPMLNNISIDELNT